MPAGDGKGLPTAHKDISSNPSGMGVTSPTDAKLKAADVDQKMRLYQVVEAFRQGRFPSNNQIDETLRWVEHNSPIDETKLSSDGRKLIKDFRSIIESARKLVMRKNEDELAQNFLFHTKHVPSDKVNPANAVSTSLTKDDAQRDAEQAAEHLRTLGKLIFTNAEFRKLLKDISYIARDVAADGAQKAANVARPGEEKLNQVDETAPSDRWHGPDGQIHGPNDPAPDTGLGAKRDALKEKKDQAVQAKDEAKGHAQDAAQRSKEEADRQPGDNSSGPSGAQASGIKNTLLQKAKEITPEDKQRQAEEHKRDAERRVDEAIANAQGPNTHAPRDGDMSRLTDDEQRAAKEAGKQAAKDKVLAVIPDEHREKVDKQIQKSKDYLREKVPEERRDRFIYRAKKVIVEQQRHRDYQEAIDFFLNMAENYHGHAKDVAKQTGDHAQGNVRGDPAFAKAELELRTLIERFANNTSMQGIFDAIDQIYSDAKNDPELKSWFTDLDKYVRRVLQEPGFVMKDQCDQEGRRLKENSKGLFNERYRGHRETLFDEVQSFFTSFADDPLNKQFGEDWKQLTKDLLLDSEGNFKYKPHLWQDVRGVILPALLRNVGYVPIPRVEYTDNMIDLVIENLTLESQNIIPNIFEIEARTYHKLSPYSGISDKSKQSVWVSFSQVQADLKDVAFYFKKKSGFPKISDHGLADVFIGGSGISGKVHIESTDRRGSVFHVREVKVKIDTLKFKLRDTKHNFLYATIRPLATGLIKKQVAKAIQDAIRSGLGALDAQLVEIRDRLDAAKEDDNTSRTDVLKNVFNEKKAKGEETAKEADAKTGTFKIVTKRDSKIINWSSEDSIVEKQGAKQDLAGQAPGWKSPAFNIVPGAKADVSQPSKGLTESSNIPSRGSHQDNSGATALAGAGAAGAGAAAVGAGAAAHHHASTTQQSSIPSSTASTIPTSSVTQPEYAQGAVTGGGLSGAPLHSSSAPGAGSSLVNPPNSGSAATSGFLNAAPTSSTTTSANTGNVSSGNVSSGLPPPVGSNL